MKKIIITGAAGLVGLSLLTLIDSSKYEITAIDKNKNNLQLIKKINPKIKIFSEDLSFPDKSWGELFKGADCVIQLQAQISAPKKEPYIRNNITSVKNVIKVCEKYKIKNLIHISSSVVISVAKDNYTNTKKIGEKLVKKSKIPYTILRPSLMYGCFDIKHLGFIVRMLNKIPFFPFPGRGNYIRQPLYALDFAKIIIKLIEKKPERKIYNIIGKEQIYFIDLIRIILKEKNKKRFLIKIPISQFLFLMKIYNFFKKQKPYTPDQLKALTAGDIFPATNWEEKLKVKYTPFKQGVNQMINSKYYNYPNLMKK